MEKWSHENSLLKNKNKSVILQIRQKNFQLQKHEVWVYPIKNKYENLGIIIQETFKIKAYIKKGKSKNFYLNN